MVENSTLLNFNVLSFCSSATLTESSSAKGKKPLAARILREVPLFVDKTSVEEKCWQRVHQKQCCGSE